MKLFGKGDHLFEPVDKEERYIELKSSEISKLEKKLNARIIRLPGHTKDSIGIIFDDEILFSGDATMNGFPSTNRVIIWIENLKEYKKSWEKMIEEDFNIVYPSHGTAFPKEELIENKDKLEDIKLYPLE